MFFPSAGSSRFQIVSTGLIIFSLLSGIHALGVNMPPPISECEMVKFSWKGDYSPFTLHILSSQNNSLVDQFVNVSANSVFWEAAVPAGTMLYLEVLDSNPADDPPSYSGNFTVLPGNDACLQSSSTSSSTATVTSTSLTMQPSDAGAAANPPERKPANALSPSAIAGIAIACLAAGLLIALGIWLIRRLGQRRSSRARSPRTPDRRQFDSYNHQKSPKSDDGWSATTSCDSADASEPRAQPPGGDTADPPWDPHLFVHEKSTPFPPLLPPPVPIPAPSPSPAPTATPVRESGTWADPSSGTAYALQAVVNGSSWGEAC